MSSEIQEVPVELPTQEAEIASEAPVEPPASEAASSQPNTTPNAPKAKKMGRPPGKKDAQPRARPKPKAKPKPIIEQRPVEAPSSSSEDEATTQELDALRLMRAVKAFDQQRNDRKYAKYASWFGR